MQSNYPVSSKKTELAPLLKIVFCKHDLTPHTIYFHTYQMGCTLTDATTTTTTTEMPFDNGNNKSSRIHCSLSHVNVLRSTKLSVNERAKLCVLWTLHRASIILSICLYSQLNSRMEIIDAHRSVFVSVVLVVSSS